MKPKPSEKAKRDASNIGRKIMFIVGIIWKNSITATTAISENPKLTSENVTFSIGKIALLILIFLISGAASTIEPIAIVVESLINEKSV